MDPSDTFKVQEPTSAPFQVPCSFGKGKTWQHGNSRGYIGFFGTMEKKMEATIQGLGFRVI